MDGLRVRTALAVLAVLAATVAGGLAALWSWSSEDRLSVGRVQMSVVPLPPGLTGPLRAAGRLGRALPRRADARAAARRPAHDRPPRASSRGRGRRAARRDRGARPGPRRDRRLPARAGRDRRWRRRSRSARSWPWPCAAAGWLAVARRRRRRRVGAGAWPSCSPPRGALRPGRSTTRTAATSRSRCGAGGGDRLGRPAWPGARRPARRPRAPGARAGRAAAAARARRDSRSPPTCTTTSSRCRRSSGGGRRPASCSPAT